MHRQIKPIYPRTNQRYFRSIRERFVCVYVITYQANNILLGPVVRIQYVRQKDNMLGSIKFSFVSDKKNR